MVDTTSILNMSVATSLDGSEWGTVVQGNTTKRFQTGLLIAAGTSVSTQAANLVFAGPTTGSAAAPSFRSLVAADMPVTLAAIAGLTPGDGAFVVGDGSTWVAESGATARSSLSVYSIAQTDAAIAAAITAEDLDFAGDSGTGAVDLDSQALTIATSNDSLVTAASSQTLTISLADVLEDLDTLGPSTADGEFLVATGPGAFAWESGATARASMGAIQDVTTTRGDIIRRGASAPERVALGTSGYLWSSDGTDAVWAGFTQSGAGATTRTWQSKVGDIVSVFDYGATGDGSTDDTAAIQAAIDSGKAVYFPKPSAYYKVTAQIDIDATTIMYGDGKGTTRIVATHSGILFSLNTVSTYGFRISNLSLEGPGSAGTGLYIASATEITAHMIFDSVKIYNFAIGIAGIEGTAAYVPFDSTFIKVDFWNCSSYGMALSGSQNAFFGCSFRVCGYGVLIDNQTGNFSQGGGAFYGCTWVQCTFDAVVATPDVRPVLFSGCWFEQTATLTVGSTEGGEVLFRGLTFENCLFQPAATATVDGVMATFAYKGSVKFDTCVVYTDLYSSGSIPGGSSEDSNSFVQRVGCYTINGSGTVTKLANQLSDLTLGVGGTGTLTLGSGSGYVQGDANHSYVVAGSTGNLYLGSGNANRAFLSTSQLSPITTDAAALGSSGFQWSDLFLASGGVINWNNGGVTITEASDYLAFNGALGYAFSERVYPSVNDGAALGYPEVSWSDLFLASGGVINFANGDTTLTHASGLLTLSASAGFVVSGTAPSYRLYESDASADAKYWDEIATAEALNFRAVNDAYSAANTWAQVTRSGATITSITLNGTTISLQSGGTNRIQSNGTGLGFFAATPVAQQATTGTTTGFTAGAGASVLVDSTHTGGSGSTAYTVGDVVLALKNYGFLAA